MALYSLLNHFVVWTHYITNIHVCQYIFEIVYNLFTNWFLCHNSSLLLYYSTIILFCQYDKLYKLYYVSGVSSCATWLFSCCLARFEVSLLLNLLPHQKGIQPILPTLFRFLFFIPCPHFSQCSIILGSSNTGRSRVVLQIGQEPLCQCSNLLLHSGHSYSSQFLLRIL